MGQLFFFSSGVVKGIIFTHFSAISLVLNKRARETLGKMRRRNTSNESIISGVGGRGDLETVLGGGVI